MINDDGIFANYPSYSTLYTLLQTRIQETILQKSFNRLMRHIRFSQIQNSRERWSVTQCLMILVAGAIRLPITVPTLQVRLLEATIDTVPLLQTLSVMALAAHPIENEDSELHLGAADTNILRTERLRRARPT